MRRRYVWAGWFVTALLVVGPASAGDGVTVLDFLGTTAPEQASDICLLNANAADTTNAENVWPGGGAGLALTGAGVTVGLWDGGSVRPTHQELIGRISVLDGAANSDHSTHVAGTIGATGVLAAARGMASQVALRSRDYFNDLAEMTADAGLIDLSNHSYGYLRGWTSRITWSVGQADTWVCDRSLYTEDVWFGKYEGAQNYVDAALGFDIARPRDLDTLLHANKHLLAVWSAGNDRTDAFLDVRGDGSYVTYLSGGPEGAGWYLVTGGVPGPDGDYDCLSQSQVAKNTLTVGSVLDHTLDPHDPLSITPSSFSSYGPTDDGRIKPDVVANGQSLYSCTSAADNHYGLFSGTSMAAPNVTGSAALLVEHYRNLHGRSPASATTKGLILHTATDVGNTGPDYSSGWGLMNTAAAADFLSDDAQGSPSDWLVDDVALAGGTLVLDVYLDGSEALKATLCWTDPAPDLLPGGGLDDPTPVLVNDMDLTVVGPDETTYYPWTLDPDNPTSPAVRSALNHVDNVEQVVIDAADIAPGWYEIVISNTGTLTGEQDISLLVSGVVPEPLTVSLLAIAGLAVLRRRRRRVR